MKKSKEKTTSMSAFFTAEKASEGVQLEIAFPNGEGSGEYITLIGADSPEYKRLTAKMNDSISKVDDDLSVEAKQIAVDDITRRAIAGCVKGWTLSEDCTTENVCKFLKNCPPAQRAIDAFVHNSENFWNPPTSSNSKNGQQPNSKSTSRSEETPS